MKDTVETYVWKWCDEMLNHVQNVQNHVMSNYQFSLKVTEKYSNT